MVAAAQMLFVHMTPTRMKYDALAKQVTQMLVQTRQSSAEV